MKKFIVLALLPLLSCASLTLAEKESPACGSLDSSILVADAQFIAQLAVDLPAGNLTAVLDAFVAAKGPAQFACAEQMAEALLGNPVQPVDAGVQEKPSALVSALALNHSAAAGALEKLQTYKVQHLLGSLH